MLGQGIDGLGKGWKEAAGWLGRGSGSGFALCTRLPAHTALPLPASAPAPVQLVPPGGGCDGSPGGRVCARRKGGRHAAPCASAILGLRRLWLPKCTAAAPGSASRPWQPCLPAHCSHCHLPAACRSLPAHRLQISAEEYNAAEADPIAPFSSPVAGHMNEDHADATRAMIKHYVGITGEPKEGEPKRGRRGGLAWLTGAAALKLELRFTCFCRARPV